MQIIYQNVQKNKIYILASNPCIIEQLELWWILGIRSTPSHMHMGFYRNALFRRFELHLIWFWCFRVSNATLKLVMSSFLYAHCIDAMLNVVLPFRYLLLPGRIRSWCEQHVRVWDRQHNEDPYKYINEQGKCIFSFEHTWSRSFFNCFESPPDIYAYGSTVFCR